MNTDNTYLILFFIFLLTSYFITRKSKVCIFVLLLQFGTLLAAFFIDGLPKIESFLDYVVLMFSLIMLSMYILPWRHYKSIKIITTKSSTRAELLFKILAIINIFAILVFFYFSYNVLTSVTDIYEFKESGLGSLSITTSGNARIFTIAKIFYPLGYMMLPFHFYYLSKGLLKKSLTSFVLSLTPVFYGLTYFSRSHPIHYILSYVALFILLQDSLPERYKLNIKKIGIIIIILFSSFFLIITFARFEFSNYYNSIASSSSIVKDPVLFSILDYFGQWHNYNYECIRQYNGLTMQGQMAFYPLGDIFRLTGIIPNSYETYLSKRVLLLGDSFDNFIGLIAYLVYDFGLIITIIFGLIYRKIVCDKKPISSSITIERLFYLFLMIQIPLFSIFYSYFDVVFQTLLYFVPIYFVSYYSKINTSK